MGFFSHADDFKICTDEDEADNLWDAMSRALEESGLMIAQAMCHITLGRS